jgi:hypothetical protein
LTLIFIKHPFWLHDPRQALLVEMGVELMSIPIIYEPERLFSGAKLLISDQQNCLGDDIIQACECLKSWLNLWSMELDMVRMEQLLEDLASRSGD